MAFYSTLIAGAKKKEKKTKNEKPKNEKTRKGKEIENARQAAEQNDMMMSAGQGMPGEGHN